MQVIEKKNRLATNKVKEKEMDKLYMNSHIRNHDVYLTKKIIDYKKRIGVNEQRAKISHSIGERMINFQDVGKEKLVQVGIIKKEAQEKEKLLKQMYQQGSDQKIRDQVRMRAMLGQQVDVKVNNQKALKMYDQHFQNKFDQEAIELQKDTAKYKSVQHQKK